ncbi:IclR family transcriptional regulator [Streptomyces sp. NPDC054962]
MASELIDNGDGAAQPSGSDDSPNYPIGSVDNALRLLRMFGEYRSVRVAEAGREIGVARSTAHRLMQMLNYHGFVVQDSVSKAYAAGPELVRMAVSVVSGLDLLTAARPVMEKMVDALEETTHVSILQGTDILFVDSIETTRSLRIGARTGKRMPAYATASGKVLLSGLDQQRLRSLYPGVQLAPSTARTLTSRRELEEQLQAVRHQGYAANFGESEDEVSAVAVPITDGRNRVRAALAIAAPLSRLQPDDVPGIARTLTEGARKIGAALPV